ncbi:subtilisin-like protease 8 [Ceratobasidium sp. AG-Ba]|nr:subtilisin-like protease 8 [Ceratobasidium sp. AG-Ba]
MIAFASIALFALASLADAAPRGKINVQRAVKRAGTNSYIIGLKNVDVVAAHTNWINTQVANTNNSWVKSMFTNTTAASGFIAYSAILDPNDPAISMTDGSALKNKDGSSISILEAARGRSDIEFIEEDQLFTTTAIQSQTNAPWGLQRISSAQALPAGSRANALTFDYNFDDAAGKGVDVYVIDTGINTAHQSFEGRAAFGFAAQGLEEVDDQGHGTHCAGTIASKDFGVAKAANVIAVKVLGADGSGATSDIIDGIAFAMQSAQQSGKPSVISMSLGGGVSTALDRAVTAATTAGVHVVVAAGNESADANTSSPARAPAVITVGASNINDQVASFSNFGKGVDIFAPGQQVISTFIGSDDAAQILSGTSMACPHVAGMVAAILSSEGQMTPAAMSDRLKTLGAKGVLKNVPAGTTNFAINTGVSAIQVKDGLLDVLAKIFASS